MHLGFAHRLRIDILFVYYVRGSHIPSLLKLHLCVNLLVELFKLLFLTVAFFLFFLLSCDSSRGVSTMASWLVRKLADT